MTIRDTILENLKDIEQKHNCKILFAIESGSRAWGFESPDSDYDVRFVYIKQPLGYLTIDDKRDVIEVPVDEVLDISGWDIRKALKLFRKCNPALLEWLVSEIVYMDEFGFRDHLRSKIPDVFSQTTIIYHYKSMALRNFKAYLQTDEVRLKKYFYVLRPIFACLWNMKYRGVPPIKFKHAMEAIDIPDDVRTEISILLEKKMRTGEMGVEPKNMILNNYIEEQFNLLDGQLDSRITKDSTAMLDELFQSYLIKVWN